MAPTLEINLKNQTNSHQVYAYVTGLALERGNHVCIIQADGKSPYYPDNPPHILAPLSKDCGIKLGKPGSTTTVTIPQLAGGRIWFSIGKTLTFLVNPGPAIVEPSVTNPSDPNINTEWAFCEFTFANDALYANISYVDFVSRPISLTLVPESGPDQKVLGLKSGGLDYICDGLISQSKQDGKDWEKLVYTFEGKRLRALSPNHGIVMKGGNLFKGYYEAFVDDVWKKYTSTPLIVDTQAQWGVLEGRVTNGELVFPGHGKFTKPSTGDVFSCSTGPFANNAGACGPLTARISAAFNRSTIHTNPHQPHKERIENYYKHPLTNHYSRLVHEANLDGRGYAFPYDDVPSAGGVDQSGFVNAKPKSFTVTIG
ncbi:glycoside hydrolase family 64 protein [Xylogone sp. PMI_703]|nr:glycoside hydrolase family 64 protein [Xylogone sp. PMI_703]